MLIIAATADIHPDDLDAAVAAGAAMVAATRREPGCIDYAFSFELGAPGKFRIFEQWTDMEALKGHFMSAHMAAFQQKLAGLKVSNLVLKFFEGAVERPFPAMR